LTEERVRVTYIVNSLRNGGAERRTLELLRHLDRERFTPSLILMEAIGLEYARELVQQHLVIGIPQGGNSHWLERSPGFIKAIWKARAQLKAWRSHIIHAMLPAPSILGGIAARLAGVPVVIGSRPCLTEVYRPRHAMVALADKAALRMARLNISNSLAARHDLITQGGCPAAKCHTIYNGVDTQRFHPDLPRVWRRSMGWTDENVIIGMIANFRTCKRHADFVRAAFLILQQHPECRFFMMGTDYGTRTAIQQQIQELELDSKVRTVEGDSAPERVFAAMDIYVCTSASESLSNVLLEAMSCGKPVIATRVGGNPEVVLDGQTGYLIPPGCPEAVVRRADRLIAEPGLRRRMGICGRQRVEEKFSLERMVRDHEELYLRLLVEKGIV
jgi:glycosyltransferase involved in cell wall biosynthesis